MPKRVLLDHMIPHRLRFHLAGEVATAKYMGWQALKNGELLDAAEEDGFDVLITNDRSLRYQQNLLARRLAVIQLDARSNDINDMLPLVPNVNEALEATAPGSFVVIVGG